ncbi:MAG TPA: hypothetical protein VFQ02_08270, partial [Nitrospira sp.]|nr:hypothetical protein [Nitrospira sp.]
MIPCWTSTRLLVCIALGSALALGGGGNVSVAQTSSDSKPDLPVKPKEPEGKPKEMEGKPVEPRLKELEQKAKEAEPKV